MERGGGEGRENIKAEEEEMGPKGTGDEKQEQNCGRENRGNSAAAPKSLGI